MKKLIYQGAEAKILLDKKNNLIIKDRVKKSYRIPELDDKIRKQRTKSEMKLLDKASRIINCPICLTIHKEDEINNYPLLKNKDKSANRVGSKLIIPYIKGEKLSEHLDKFPLQKQKQICRKVGEDVAKLHDNDIIHGDLTTSNMILVKKNPASQINDSKINTKKSKSKSSLELAQKDIGLTTFSEVIGLGGGINTNITNFKIFFIDFGLGFISHKIEDKAVDIHLLKQALEAKHFKNWKILFDEFVDGYKTSKNSEKVLEQLNKVEKRGRYKG